MDLREALAADMRASTKTATVTIEVTKSWDDETQRFWYVAAATDPSDLFGMPFAYSDSGSCESAVAALQSLAQEIDIEFDEEDKA